MAASGAQIQFKAKNKARKPVQLRQRGTAFAGQTADGSMRESGMPMNSIDTDAPVRPLLPPETPRSAAAHAESAHGAQGVHASAAHADAGKVDTGTVESRTAESRNSASQDATGNGATASETLAPRTASAGRQHTRYRFSRAAPARNFTRYAGGATAAPTSKMTQMPPMQQPVSPIAPVPSIAPASAASILGAAMPIPPVLGPTVDEDEIDRRFAATHKKRRSLAARVVRGSILTLSVLLVMTAGLITMLWIEDNGGLKATVAMIASKSDERPQQNVVTITRQPNREELPYDGMTEDDADRIAARAAIPLDRSDVSEDELAAAAGKSAATKSATGDQKTTQAAQKVATANAAAKDRANNAAPAPAAGDAADSTTAGTTASDASAEAGISSGASDADSDGASGDGASDSAAAKTAAKQVSKPSAKAAAKASAAQRIARGKEISRIQRQAAEELKKKTRLQRNRAIAAAKRKARQQNLTHNVLARCERMDNLFRRERCKWSICNGKWGKGGCPSFTSQPRVASN